MEINVNLNNLVKNILEIKKNLNENTKLLFMVKSNAYNHGNIRVCKATEMLVDCFGVATIEEGVKLRNNGIKIPILVFMVTDFSLCDIVDYDLTAVCCDINILEKLNTYANNKNKKARIHLSIDSGMNRIGLKCKEEINEFKREFAFFDNLILEGICSHFYSNQKDIISSQYTKFLELASYFDDKLLIKHIASSESFINYPNSQLDMVRIGLAGYGYSTCLDVSPVMEVVSEVIAVKKVNKNEVIGYNGKFLATKNMKIAIVGGGYADGISRNFTNKFVCINGQKCQIVGNICMDMFMVDITNVFCEAGDKVTILGKNRFCEMTACEFAENNTITYEILTGFKGKFIKKYIL